MNNWRFVGLWAICAVGAGAASADAVRSYHVGNSLTGSTQPSGMAALATQRGHTLTWDWHIRTGSSLTQITGDDGNASFGGLYRDNLDDLAWDFVTLQPGPGGGATVASELSAAVSLIDLTRQNPANASTRFFVYSGFPGRDDYSTVYTTPTADADDTPAIITRDFVGHFTNRLRAAVAAEVYVIPVAEVLYLLDQRMQSGLVDGWNSIEELFGDSVHLNSGAGHYICGVTAYSVMFGEDPHGLTPPYPYTVGTVPFTAELTEAIHDAVWDVVTASPHLTGVPEPASLALIGAGSLALIRRR